LGELNRNEKSREIFFLIFYLEVIIRTLAPFEAREYAKWKSKVVFPLSSGP
jgi:hypothetical protein